MAEKEGIEHGLVCIFSVLEIAGVDGKWDVYQTTRGLDCVRTYVGASSPIALAEESVFTIVSK